MLMNINQLEKFILILYHNVFHRFTNLVQDSIFIFIFHSFHLLFKLSKFFQKIFMIIPNSRCSLLHWMISLILLFLFYKNATGSILYYFIKIFRKCNTGTDCNHIMLYINLLKVYYKKSKHFQLDQMDRINHYNEFKKMQISFKRLLNVLIRSYILHAKFRCKYILY